MILQFIQHNFSDIIIILFLVIVSVIPLIPPTWAGLNKEHFDYNLKEMVAQKKLNFWESIITLFASLFNRLLIGAALSVQFRRAVTIILFLVLGADLVINRKITDNATKLVIVSIVALYLEVFLEKASEIAVWKIFTWKAKTDNQAANTNPQAPVA